MSAQEEIERLEHSSPHQEWRPVVGFEGLYEVTREGVIRSIRSGKAMTHSVSGDGYRKVAFWKDGKRHQLSVHRIVAKAFVDGFESNKEVNHKNGVKSDNRSENLEWVTKSENINHAHYVLGKAVNAVVAIHVDTGEIRRYQSIEMAVRDGFNSGHIYRCINTPHKIHKGFVWREASQYAPPADSEQVLVGALEEYAAIFGEDTGIGEIAHKALAAYHAAHKQEAKA